MIKKTYQLRILDQATNQPDLMVLTLQCVQYANEYEIHVIDYNETWKHMWYGTLEDKRLLYTWIEKETGLSMLDTNYDYISDLDCPPDQICINGECVEA